MISEMKSNTILRGFEHINRYWDKTNNMYSAKILPGEYYVTTSNEFIVTVLGSCISACIRDRVKRIGGMNHFMLPETTGDGRWAGGSANTATRYGNFAMEHMINDILKNGGKRENLEVKICGGGRILQRMTDIGMKNIAFVRTYLSMEGLALLAEDVGDIYPRKVQYMPMNGKLRVKRLLSLHNDTIVQRESKYMHELEDTPVAGEVELF